MIFVIIKIYKRKSYYFTYRYIILSKYQHSGHTHYLLTLMSKDQVPICSHSLNYQYHIGMRWRYRDIVEFKINTQASLTHTTSKVASLNYPYPIMRWRCYGVQNKH